MNAYSGQTDIRNVRKGSKGSATRATASASGSRSRSRSGPRSTSTGRPVGRPRSSSSRSIPRADAIQLYRNYNDPTNDQKKYFVYLMDRIYQDALHQNFTKQSATIALEVLEDNYNLLYPQDRSRFYNEYVQVVTEVTWNYL